MRWLSQGTRFETIFWFLECDQIIRGKEVPTYWRTRRWRADSRRSASYSAHCRCVCVTISRPSKSNFDCGKTENCVNTFIFHTWNLLTIFLFLSLYKNIPSLFFAFRRFRRKIPGFQNHEAEFLLFALPLSVEVENTPENLKMELIYFQCGATINEKYSEKICKTLHLLASFLLEILCVTNDCNFRQHLCLE